MADESAPVTGAPASNAAPKGRRAASAIIDLILIPVALGVLAGLLLIRVPDAIRNVSLIVVNIAWLLFRDTVFSPGRKMVGLKLVNYSGEKATLGQAFIRNILIVVPFVLVIGYILELIFVLAKGNRLADGWAKTRVVAA